MKIKIELEGLTLEQATGLTNYLSGFNPLQAVVEDANENISQSTVLHTTYPLEVRRPYSTESKIVNSPEEREAFLNSEKPKQTRKRAEKVEAPIIETQEDASEDAIEDAQEETKIEAIEVVEPETVSVPTLMQIRSLVAQKAAEHKDAIKAKLVELGAQNVSTLDAKHFKTIFTFLNEL